MKETILFNILIQKKGIYLIVYCLKPAELNCLLIILILRCFIFLKQYNSTINLISFIFTLLQFNCYIILSVGLIF